jgi:hypothetical protein
MTFKDIGPSSGEELIRKAVTADPYCVVPLLVAYAIG